MSKSCDCAVWRSFWVVLSARMKLSGIRLVSIVPRSQVPRNLWPSQYSRKPAEEQTLLEHFEQAEEFPPNLRVVRALKSRPVGNNRWVNSFDGQSQLHKQALIKLKKSLRTCTCSLPGLWISIDIPYVERFSAYVVAHWIRVCSRARFKTQ